MSNSKSKKVLPNRLREHRIRIGYTQDQVARYLGVDTTTVSNHELGTRQLIGRVITDYVNLYRIDPLSIFHVLEDDGSVVAED